MTDEEVAAVFERLPALVNGDGSSWSGAAGS